MTVRVLDNGPRKSVSVATERIQAGTFRPVQVILDGTVNG